MGFKIAKDATGVKALKDLSKHLKTQLETTNTACDNLKRAYDSVKKSVAHEKEIEEILTHIAKINSDTVVSIVELANALNQTAKRLENFLNGGLGGGNP